jgi:hypothetical protein
MQKTRFRSQLSPIAIGIIVLTLATALIHFYLNVLMGKIDPLFTLNGLGYLALLAALFLPLPLLSRYRPLIKWVMVIYTLITIAAWIFLGARDFLGYLDKLIEAALVVLLLLYRPQH